MQDSITEIEKKIYRAMKAQYEAIYLLNIEEKTYQAVKSSELWDGILGKEGTLFNLYGRLFTESIKYGMEKGSSSSNKYGVFINEDFFKKDRGQGWISIPVDGENRAFIFSLIKLSDTESGLIFSPFDDVVNSDKVEKEKIDTVQENYLFSMIIDLDSDTCINANVTEVGVNAQSVMELKYSDWRNMISNMFLPEEQSIFFMISSPEYLLRGLEKDKKLRKEILMMNMVGEYIWVRLEFTRMKGFGKKHHRVVYTVMDVDEEMRQLLNQENIILAVEEKNKQLQRADQAKSTFISNMSHEIRTPINAVLGMNEMILRECEDEKIISYANDIKSASKMLLSIINDILDFSKIESGNMEIIPVEYSTKGLITDVCMLINGRLKDKPLGFEVNLDKKIPEKLCGDEIRITQVIINILTNAVKYTETGKITFSMDSNVVDEKHVALTVCVEDTGIGMKEEEMDKLFSAFARLDERRNRNIEGTGLGMSIVTRLLNQMGSKLEVESIYGVGSKFFFTLEQEIVDGSPIGDFNPGDTQSGKQSSEKSDKENNKTVVASKAKILAVDDNKTNLRVLKALLKKTKANVTLAASGPEAIELLKQEEFNLVFLDHFMPEMDGIETLKEIKKLGSEYKDMPIIALTANVVSGAKEYYLGVGFSDFLEKPINVEMLDSTLVRYLPAKLFD